MAVLGRIRHTDNPDVEEYLFFCPGCQCGHAITVKAPEGWRGLGEARWAWNGSLDSPTFHPSILHPGFPPREQFRGSPRCHCFVSAGNIEFGADSTHELAGKTVKLPDLDSLGSV